VAIGVNDRQVQAIDDSNCDDAALAIISSAILHFDGQPVEDRRREREVKSAIDQVRVALVLFPLKAHKSAYNCIYTGAKGPPWGNSYEGTSNRDTHASNASIRLDQLFECEKRGLLIANASAIAKSRGGHKKGHNWGFSKTRILVSC
jgi:hypothetical protein